MFGAISMTAFLYALSGFVTGATSLSLAAFVILKNPSNEINRSWAYFCTAVAIWGFFGGALGLAKSPEDALFWGKMSHAGGSPMIAPTFYHFALSLIGLTRKKRTSLYSAYAAGLGFSLINLLTPHYFTQGILVLSSFYWVKGGPAFLLMLVWWIPLVIYSHILLYRHYRIASDNRRNQIRLIFSGTAIGYLGGSTSFLIALGVPVYPYGNWAIPVYTLLATYAIIRYKALDIQTVVHKTAMWAVVSSVVLVPLYGVLKLTRPWLETLPTWGISFFSLGLFFLTTIYYRTIQPRIDHLFQRRKYDLQQVLDHLLERLAVLGDVQEVARQIVKTLGETLYAHPAALLLVDEKCSYYRCFQHAGNASALQFSLDDPFLKWLRHSPGVIEIDAIEQNPAYPEIKEAVHTFVSATQAVVFVPLSTGHESIALIYLGPKTNLKPYNRLDLQLMDKLRVEAAIALSNSALYDRVMTLNTELTRLNSQLEQKVRERTAELEMANQQLSNSNQKIAEADRAKTQFLASMSHELRTPLNAIIGFSRILRKGIDGPLTEKQREDLDAIHHSGTHLLGLINELLDLSKIEAGKIELIEETVDLKQVVEGVISTAKVLVKEKRVALRVEIDRGLPFVQGDPMRLRQVVLNLVSNAIKFTNRGEVEVRAQSRGAYVVVSVRDTGCGIRQEDQGKLFEEFRQLGGGAKGGTGLGLAISKRLVQLHGGEIWLESRIGEGCTFNFSLPVKNEGRAAISA